MKTPGFLLDLDGTLADTAPDIHAAASRMLADLNRPPVSPAQAREHIGDGMPRFVKRLLTGERWQNPDAELFARAHDLMLRHYERECVASPRVYPGVREALAKLRADGFGLACVTNKPRRFTIPLLSACGLADFFPVVACGDSPEMKKPRPDSLLFACEGLGLQPADAVMVGDSAATDGRAALAAGCKFVGVSYGYGLDPFPPDAIVVDSLTELLSLESLETAPLASGLSPGPSPKKTSPRRAPDAHDIAA